LAGGTSIVILTLLKGEGNHHFDVIIVIQIDDIVIPLTDLGYNFQKT